MELTRKQVIEILEKADSTVYKEPKTKTAQALEYAISSLKTDEAYQIMYEGGEVFTKDEVAAMLTELNKEIEEKSIIDYDEALYDGGECVISISEINNIIQQKINTLEGKDNGK